MSETEYFVSFINGEHSGARSPDASRGAVDMPRSKHDDITADRSKSISQEVNDRRSGEEVSLDFPEEDDPPEADRKSDEKLANKYRGKYGHLDNYDR